MNLFKMFPISSLFWCFAFIPYYSESCGEVSFNVTSGIVRLQDLHHDVTEDFNCLWFYTAPPGRELLVKVDHVHLNSPRRRWTSLKLNVDDQTLDLPSKCVRCLSEIVAGQELRIVFTYKTRTSKRGRTGSLHLGSFQIRFKAFDPFLCEPPVAPKNGYIITEQRRVGNTIEYRCNPPFELGGNPHSRCRIPKSSPIPEWSEPSPKCTIPDCTDGVIHKVAGRGVISNPGYESKRLLPQRQCRWEIMAGRGERIKVFFPYIQLKGEETTELNIYDGGLFRPLTNLTLLTKKTKSELVTSTNKLIVFFRTGDVPNSSELQGFFMEYWNISGLCFHPGQIENGEVVGQNFIIGSTVRFLCHPNFHLIGAQSATCLPGGRWNVSKPRCHFLNLTLSSSETFGLFEFLVNSRPVQAPDESSQSSSNMFSTTLSSSSEDENQFVFSVTPAFTSFSRNYLSNAVETTSVISFSHSFSHTSTEDSKNHLQRNSTKDSKNHLQRNSTKDSKNHLQRNSTKDSKNHLQRNSTEDSKNHLQRSSTQDSKDHVQRNLKTDQENVNRSQLNSHNIFKKILGLNPVQHDSHSTTSRKNSRPSIIVKDKALYRQDRPSRHRLSEQTTMSILEVGFLHPDQTVSFQSTQPSTKNNLEPYLDTQTDSYTSNENKGTDLDPQVDSYLSDKTTEIHLYPRVNSFASHNKSEIPLDFQADSFALDKNDSREDNRVPATGDTVEDSSSNEENTTLTEKSLVLILVVATSVLVLLVFLVTVTVVLYKKRNRSSSGTPACEKSKNDNPGESE